VRVRRALRATLVVTSALLAVAAAGFVAGAVGSPAGASTVRAVGSDAVDDIIVASNAHDRPECGLGADRLAAMMLAPVFHETGAVWYPNTAPSPMTLGRWDDRDALWAFGDRATGYQRAFWVAGVGMWQFDSAGGWNMTAADAISTWTSANQAAATMAARYCASQAADTVDRMKYAWSLWYACVSGERNVCVDRFNEMFVGGQFTNIRRDPGVGRLGGAVPTTCRLGPTTQVACHRVDPARGVEGVGHVGERRSLFGALRLTCLGVRGILRRRRRPTAEGPEGHAAQDRHCCDSSLVHRFVLSLMSYARRLPHGSCTFNEDVLTRSQIHKRLAREKVPRLGR